MAVLKVVNKAILAAFCLHLKDQHLWPTLLDPIQMSLRCTVSKGTTGFSPHQIIAGRHMKTGIDWAYAQTLEKKEDVDEYIKSLVSQLQVIHEATKANNNEN